MKLFFYSCAALFVIAVTYWSHYYQKSSNSPIVDLEIPNNIDYYLKNSLQRSFKEDGSLDFTLKSDYQEHFKLEDKSRLLQPDIEVLRKTHWHVVSQLGYFFHPEEVLTFQDNVNIHKKSTRNPFYIWSEDLLFNIKLDIVISKSDVKVEADNWNLDAKSMTLNLDKEIHSFTTVEATYRNDKNT